MDTTADPAFQAKTLAGDVRDMFLDVVRHIEKPWTKLSEREQRAIIDSVALISRKVVRSSIATVADRGFPHLAVSVSTKGKWNAGIAELSCTVPLGADTTHMISAHGGGSAVLQLVDYETFMGQRASAKVDKDEPELPIEEQPPAWETDWARIQRAETLEGESIDLTLFPEGMREEIRELALGKGAAITELSPGEAAKASTAAGDAHIAGQVAKRRGRRKAAEGEFPTPPAMPEAAAA